MLEHDASMYPPGPVLMLTRFVDIICNATTTPLQCEEWRDYVPFGWAEPPSGWFSYRIGTVSELFPPWLSYQDYVDDESSPTTTTSYSLPVVFKYAFKTPSTHLADLTTPTTTMVLLLLVLMLGCIKSILLPYFSSIGRRAGRHTHGVEWEKQNEERIVKFGEYVFRLLYHFLISLYGIWYFCDKEWWTGSTTTLWKKFPYDPVEPGMAWYYLVQSAYNVEALVALAKLSFEVSFQNPIQNKQGDKRLVSPIRIGWSKTVRGDFREMAIHHVVTNLLIIGSSYFRFTRVGSMVFLVHDISDVPVDLSKLANFLKWKITTACCFFTMVLMWLWMRLTILPFVIYRSILWEAHLVLETKPIDPVYFYTYRQLFYVLVGLIIFLHVVWFFMFIRMGWILIHKGETHDLSEHKDGEKHASTTTTTNNNGVATVYHRSSSYIDGVVADDETNGKATHHDATTNDGYTNGTTNGHLNGKTKHN